MKHHIFYVCVLIFSVLFLLIGNRVANTGRYVHETYFESTFYSGVVEEIVQVLAGEDSGWGFFGDTTIYFTVRITTRGDMRNEIVMAAQYVSEFAYSDERIVEPGDRIIVVHDTHSNAFFFSTYARINIIIIAMAIFLILVVVVGKAKGLNALIALGFTCMSVFTVLIPSILSGRNIYATAIIVCIYSIISTLLIVIGPNRKAVSAILGCMGGILLAGILMLLLDRLLGLTGVVDQDARMLTFLPMENPIDLRALIFAGVIIGAVGAIIDVALSISSSLWEIKEAGGESSFNSILKYGMNIGKDILGTQLNTLVLAYIGSSLSVILLIFVHSTSNLDLFNMEMIIVELLRALVGSFGMFMTIPLTALVCAWLYDPENYKEV